MQIAERLASLGHSTLQRFAFDDNPAATRNVDTDDVLDAFSSMFHVGSLALKPTHEVVYEFPGRDGSLESRQRIAFRSSYESPIQMIGPLYFVSMRELGENPELKSFDQLQDVRHYTDRYCGKIGYSPTLSSQRDLIHLVHPHSAVFGYAINNFTAAMVASMLSVANRFEGALAIDAGASRSSNLSLVAGLNLGSKRVLMIDKCRDDLNQAFAMAEIQKNFKCPSSRPLFRAFQGNLTSRAILTRLAEMIDDWSGPVVVMLNMGPWKMYGNANRMAMEFFAAQPRVSTIINGGYNLFEFDQYHGLEFQRMQTFLRETWGFRVDELRCARYSGTLIAQRG